MVSTVGMMHVRRSRELRRKKAPGEYCPKSRAVEGIKVEAAVSGCGEALELLPFTTIMLAA